MTYGCGSRFLVIHPERVCDGVRGVPKAQKLKAPPNGLGSAQKERQG